MASTTIEEYLVSLGFKLDQDSWNKFNGGLARSTASAAALGATVVATAASVSLAIGKIAQGYTDLYFVSQRTGASIGTLRAYEFGIKNIGLSYDQARAASENFAASVRMNPGLQGLLKSMGIDPNNAATASNALIGKLRSQFGEGGYFVAARMASMYGLDETTFKQMWSNYDELNKKQAEYSRRLKESGLDSGVLAQKSRDFTQATDSLIASLGILTDQVADRWLPSMTEGVNLFDKISQGLIKVGKDTDGWSSTILSLIAALGGLKASAWVLSLIPGMGGVAAALGGAAGAGLGAVTAPVVAGAGALMLGHAASKTTAGQEFKGTGDFFKDARAWGGAVKPTLQRWLGVSESGNKGEVIDYFMKQGWSREQATGLAANFYAESKFSTAAIGDGGRAHGIAQWHPDRQANFKKLFGKDVLAGSLQEQMAFANWELNNTEKKAGDRLRGARTAGEAGSIVSQYYERPKNVMGEAMSRGNLAQRWFDTGAPNAPAGGGATISQKTDIHVSSTDPKAAAADVAAAQERVNGDLVRNMKGAVR